MTSEIYFAEDDWAVDEARWHCVRNRAELERSSRCGCFFCAEVFSHEDITWWMRDSDNNWRYCNPDSPYTAICPHCMVDHVIGSAGGFEITREFLILVRRYVHGDTFEDPSLDLKSTSFLEID